MIKQDEIGNYITILGILIPIFVWLFVKDFVWLFPAFLCLAGLAIERWLVPKADKGTNMSAVEMTPDTPKRVGNIFLYVVITMASLIIVSMITPSLLRITSLAGFTLELTGFDLLLFGILMAIGEERLFRGGLFFRIARTTKSFMLTTVLTAGLFTVYHLAVYGDDPNALLFVVSAGLLLGFVNIISEVMTTSLIAHIGANTIAYSPLGLAGMFAFFQDPWFLLVAGAAFLVLIMFLFKNKRSQ